jgi:hypothetical protein
MARITPKTNWVANNVPVAPDFNRIENNNQQAFTEIDAETAARQAAITAEQNARTAAIGVETTNRQNADATLQTNIDTANSLRLSGDNAVQNNLNSHTGSTTAHFSTSTAEPSRIVQRDTNGQSSFGTPSISTHVATKGYVDLADASKLNNGVLSNNGGTGSIINIESVPVFVTGSTYTHTWTMPHSGIWFSPMLNTTQQPTVTIFFNGNIFSINVNQSTAITRTFWRVG